MTYPQPKIQQAMRKVKSTYTWEYQEAMVSFQDNLHRLMAEQHLTQEALANKANIQQEAVSRHLRGYSPTLKTLAKYAHAFGVEIRELV
jgi:predicted transcriptional regulator